MAEDKRANPYPYVSQEEAKQAPGDPAAKAARNIATREFQGIPQRAFILGDNDHSPVMRSLRSFTPEVYRLVDLVDGLSLPPDHDAQRQADIVRDMLDNPVTWDSMGDDDEG